MDGSASPAASNPAPAGGDATSSAATSAVSAPDWVPEQFRGDFGKDTYAEKVTRAYSDTFAKLSTRNDDLRKQVTDELAAARREKMPKTAAEYQVRIEPGSDADVKLKQFGVTLVDDLTGQVPEGAYILNKDSETVAAFREFAFKHEIPSDAFEEMVQKVILRDVARDSRQKAEQEKLWQKQDEAEVQKLGQNGAERKKLAESGIRAAMIDALGPEKGKEAGTALALACVFAGGVEGIETLLSRLNGGLSPGGSPGGVQEQSPAHQMFPHLVRK